LAVVRGVEVGEEVVVDLSGDEVEAGLGAVREVGRCVRVERGGRENGGIWEGEEGVVVVGLDERDVLVGKAWGGSATLGVAGDILC